MSTLIPPAIEILFDKYFNQTISPEEMAQLEAWLAEDPAHAELLARAGLAHGLTREVVRKKMQSNLRPRVLHFAKPALLAASVLLAVGIGIWALNENKKETVVATSDPRLVDANGDGIGDSLWFYPQKPSAGETRYASGVHIEELSRKLNVNTAETKPVAPTAPAAMAPSPSSHYHENYTLGAGKPSNHGVWGGKGKLAGKLEESSKFTVYGRFEVDGAAEAVENPSYGTATNLHGSFLTLKDADATVHLNNPPPASRDQYAHLYDNKFTSPLIQPLSTFSVDVDTAAYANMRRFISEGQLPPPDAVRIEELLNYFSYDYAPPAVLKPGETIGEQAPFAAHTEVCACPWNPAHKLVRIGLKGAEVDMSQRKAAHLTFLVDVSGSMDSPDKLPLAKAALVRLLAQLRPDDHVSLVVYAGSSGCVLENAPCSEKAQILGAIDKLSSGGSTAGAQGINQAYELAQKHFIKDGVNRVILCTDGDFNVGVADTGSLIRLAKDKANPENGEGVFLSTCGFGRGNLNDHMMEQIADAGNGNYAYIDTLAEAEKVFVKQAGGTLITIAKDVKLQLEFNPAKVGKYRLIGYENRVLKAEDFNDDTVDAGDIGAGHTVTALYEIEPVGANPYASVEEEIKDLERQVKEIQDFAARARLTAEAAAAQKQALDALAARIEQLKKPTADRSVDPLTYQNERKISAKAQESGDLLTLKLRYKSPEAKAEQGTSKLLTFTLKDADTTFDKASADTRFAASVAAFGMVLRGSEHKGKATLGWVAETAEGTYPKAWREMPGPATLERIAQRQAFVELVRKTAQQVK